jgi:hypothetical protein
MAKETEPISVMLTRSLFVAPLDGEKVKAGVAGGKLFCPVSWGILEELFLQGGESLLRTAALMEELSLNACFIMRKEAYQWEFARSLGRSLNAPVNDSLIPTGQLSDVKNTPFDFLKPKKIGKDIPLVKGGYDHNFVLNSDGKSLVLAARASEPMSGRVMEMRTTQPAVQLYTGNHLKHGGFCLETQHYPDSVNRPDFPSTILRPGKTFKSTTTFEFSTK